MKGWQNMEPDKIDEKINHEVHDKMRNIANGDIQPHENLTNIFRMRKECAIEFLKHPSKPAIDFIEMCNAEIKRAFYL